MRYVLRLPLITTAAAGLLLVAAPAAVAKTDTSASEAQMIEMADKLADDTMQDSIAAAVERLTGVMMKLPVGEFAAAVEEARPGSVKTRIPKDATLADLAGDDAQHMPETLGKQSRVAMTMMSGFARAFAKMMPEFENIARDIGAEMDRVK